MDKNKCSICKRKFTGITYNWANMLVGIQNIKCCCKECDLSIREQMPELIDEIGTKFKHTGFWEKHDENTI